MGERRVSREELRTNSDDWTEQDCVRWVARNIENDLYDKMKRCPDRVNPIAFNMLRWVRGVQPNGKEGPSRRDEFWKGLYMKMLAAKLNQDEDAREDTGEYQQELIDKAMKALSEC